MANSLEEKRKSISNTTTDVLDARVIANYGDPGLDEDYHFDILSRYVIVMIESAYRIPTVNKWNKVFAIVKRPEHLWVTAEGGRASSPNSQRRSDAMGNISIGLANNFSVAGIPRINFPYQIGEQIKIKKIAQPITLPNHILSSDTTPSLFISEFTDNEFTYNSWHSEGSTLAYFAGNTVRTNYLRAKTIFRPDDDQSQEYGFSLYKYQYEAFFLNLVSSDLSLMGHATAIFANTIPSSNAIYHADGGYTFTSQDHIDFLSCEYEDINVGNKQRVTTNECMPLIVATPNTFPTPRVRAVGTINYNPTYSPIVAQD
jgi:hypothetical protein